MHKQDILYLYLFKLSNFMKPQNPLLSILHKFRASFQKSTPPYLHATTLFIDDSKHSITSILTLIHSPPSNHLLLEFQDHQSIQFKHPYCLNFIKELVNAQQEESLNFMILSADQFAKYKKNETKPKKLFCLSKQGVDKQLANALLSYHHLKQRLVFIDSPHVPYLHLQAFTPLKSSQLYSHNQMSQRFTRRLIPRNNPQMKELVQLFSKSYSNRGSSQKVVCVIEREQGLFILAVHQEGTSLLKSIGSGLGLSQKQALKLLDYILKSFSSEELEKWVWCIRLEDVEVTSNGTYNFRKLGSLIQSESEEQTCGVQDNLVRIGCFMYEVVYGMPPCRIAGDIKKQIKVGKISFPGKELSITRLIKRLMYRQISLLELQTQIYRQQNPHFS